MTDNDTTETVVQSQGDDPSLATANIGDTGAPPETTEQPEPVQAEAEPEAADDEIDKRLARLAHDARVAKREANRLRQELEIAKGQRTETTDEQVDRLATAKAEQMAAVKVFNAECDRIAVDGEKELGAKFAKSVEAFNESIPFGSQQWVETVQAAIEAGQPHRILHYLGENSDEAERISQLDPARRGAAIAKIATKLSTPKPVSKAPPPVKTIASGGASNGVLDPNKDIAAWMKAEDKREADKRRGKFS